MTPTIAIIIPYCDRADHLALTLPILLDYEGDARPWIIVVQQIRSTGNPSEVHPFNRGLLCNLGARLVMAEQPGVGLICFHDVDMTPGEAVYACDAGKPASLVGARGPDVDHMEETPNGYFGGVVVFRPADLRSTAGFSNQYWGWGDEDIDLRMRVEMAGLEIDYRDSRFLHRKHKPNIVREWLIENHKRLGKTQDGRIKPADDGLATMPTLEPTKRNDRPGGTDARPTLITHVTYAVDRPAIDAEYAKHVDAAAKAAADTMAATLEDLGISPE